MMTHPLLSFSGYLWNYPPSVPTQQGECRVASSGHNGCRKSRVSFPSSAWGSGENIPVAQSSGTDHRIPIGIVSICDDGMWIVSALGLLERIGFLLEQ
jgi:hypothetical protein